MKAFQVIKTNYFIVLKIKLFGVLIHVYVRKKKKILDKKEDQND